MELFNYNDIFFSFVFETDCACTHRSHDFALNYVHSGEMVLTNSPDSNNEILISKGECVFIPRDHHVTFQKKPANGEPYCGIFLRLTRKFLREMYSLGQFGRVNPATKKFKDGAIKLERNPELASLFTSMTPYFNSGVKPHDDLMRLKLQEGLLALLHIDKRFAPTLFDFNEPWKIDILDFLNDNYMYEFTMQDLAHYTGRSLATFKRDFKKISDLTPEKWLIKRRLEAAYDKIANGGRKVADVYSEVGFKNPSHFSTAFKRQYGFAPTALLAM